MDSPKRERGRRLTDVIKERESAAGGRGNVVGSVAGASVECGTSQVAGMIQVYVRMIAPPEKLDEIVRTWRARLSPTRALSGCLDCRLYRDVDHPSAVILVELWQDHAAWEQHALSAWFREVLIMVEWSSAPPEIVFRRMDATWGLPYLAALQSARESPAARQTWNSPGDDRLSRHGAEPPGGLPVA